MIETKESPSIDQRIESLTQQYQQAVKEQQEARDTALRLEGAIQALSAVKQDIWEGKEDGRNSDL